MSHQAASRPSRHAEPTIINRKVLARRKNAAYRQREYLSEQEVNRVITAATQVDHRPIGTGKMGPITSKLRGIFGEVLHGCSPKYCLWNTPVYE